ncbi:MAG: adenosylcobinamide-GDP ribazoletransferase [Dehalococcoidia bacterium]|nr:adenosylcobinamide-GDP ribazoletransferase [Dehalococcoidia bacterium]
MNGLLAAIGLLSRLPAGGGAWAPERAAGWVPAVGLLIGGSVAGATWGAHALLPPLPAAAVAVAVWAAVTGGLHLDGAADAADAALVAAPRERRVAILGDVHHGTYGVAAVVLIVILKVSCLASLPGGTAAGAAFAAAAGARGWLPAVARAFPPLRQTGMGAAFRGGCGWSAVLTGAAAAIGAGGAVLGWWGLVVAAAGASAMLLASWGLTRAFGGLNGDAYGACIELGECVALLAAVLLAEQVDAWAAWEAMG